MPSPATTPLLVILALVTSSVGARMVVPSLGDAMARRLAKLAALIPSPDDGRTDSAREQEQGPSPAEPAPADSPAPRRADVRPHHRAARTDSGSGAIDIPADRVAHLTEKQLRSLRVADALDADGRAIGARLQGVGALGVGLIDGDVVTSIDGRATPDVSSATAAAMQVYASNEPVARATVLRGGRTLLVTVHLPGRMRPRGSH